MSRSQSSLTTTSYAILGLLSVRSFTTYELAQQMDRALGHFWPRTRSKLYEEPKKLVAAGLATARPERVGQRPRTVYTITEEGRRALESWVPTPPAAGPALEFEHLVKVFFAEHGTKADLLATIRAARQWSDAETMATGHIPREYLESNGPFPERLPWLILVGQFLDDFLAMVADWADWAEQVVSTWPDDIGSAPPAVEALERQAERAERVALRNAAPPL
jgi:PadR family transcriptional regulator AphA